MSLASARDFISIQPHVQGGAPCINNTRMTAVAIANFWWTFGTLSKIEEAYPGFPVTEGIVKLCCWYLGRYGGETWEHFSDYTNLHATPPTSKRTPEVERLHELLTASHRVVAASGGTLAELSAEIENLKQTLNEASPPPAIGKSGGQTP